MDLQKLQNASTADEIEEVLRSIETNGVQTESIRDELKVEGEKILAEKSDILNAKSKRRLKRFLESLPRIELAKQDVAKKSLPEDEKLVLTESLSQLCDMLSTCSTSNEAEVALNSFSLDLSKADESSKGITIFLRDLNKIPTFRLFVYRPAC